VKAVKHLFTIPFLTVRFFGLSEGSAAPRAPRSLRGTANPNPMPFQRASPPPRTRVSLRSERRRHQVTPPLLEGFKVLLSLLSCWVLPISANPVTTHRPSVSLQAVPRSENDWAELRGHVPVYRALVEGECAKRELAEQRVRGAGTLVPSPSPTPPHDTVASAAGLVGGKAPSSKLEGVGVTPYRWDKSILSDTHLPFV
jgi:hypothetical protein